MNLPKIRSYGNYSSSNYGAHCLRVDMGKLTVWFSYQTAIAFQVDGHARVVRANEWGPTTGKHLNMIDNGNKKARISGERFEAIWKEQLPELAMP